jgi:hypothetical protein
MSDGKCRHPRRTIGKIRHQHRLGRWICVDDGIFRHPHVVGLRHAWLFNSAGQLPEQGPYSLFARSSLLQCHCPA